MIGGNLKNELGKRFAVSINNINTDDSGNAASGLVYWLVIGRTE